MIKKKNSKQDLKNKIQIFFSDLKNKSSEEVKKLKKISKKNKISLLKNKKLFCKKCLTPFQGDEKIRIKKSHKTIECKICGEIKRIYLSKKLQMA